jgi:enterochelin esterase-like enzyme
MDAATYDELGLSLPHHEKEPPGGMINLNTGQPNSWGRAGDPVAANPLDALYTPGPLATERLADAPAGVVHHHRDWASSAHSIYPETTRDWAVYVPAQVAAPGAPPAALLVCLDGAGFLNEEGAYRTCTVADNLVHTGKMPPTVIVFINPVRERHC